MTKGKVTKYQNTDGIPYYFTEVYRLGWNDAYWGRGPNFPGDGILHLARSHGEKYHYFAAAAIYNAAYADGMVVADNEGRNKDDAR